MLETEPDIRIVGEAANGREALALADYWRPDIVVLDLNLSPITGLAVARDIIRKVDNVRIIFVSSESDEQYVAGAFRAGAHAYVLAASAQTDLIHAIRVVAEERRFVSPSIPSKVVDA